MKAGFLADAEPASAAIERLRIDRFMVRLLDSRKAELRIRAVASEQLEDIGVFETAGWLPSLRLVVSDGAIPTVRVTSFEEIPQC